MKSNQEIKKENEDKVLLALNQNRIWTELQDQAKLLDSGLTWTELRQKTGLSNNGLKKVLDRLKERKQIHQVPGRVSKSVYELQNKWIPDPKIVKIVNDLKVTSEEKNQDYTQYITREAENAPFHNIERCKDRVM